MILSCQELHNDFKGDPTRWFMVKVSANEGLDEILRICGKIPKPNEDRGEEWNGWKVNDIEMRPDSDDVARIRVSYRPPQVVVAEKSYEPKFSPYSGPVGKQPDGSFVLTPRAWSYLHKAMLWSSHWGIGGYTDPPVSMAASSMKDFWRVFCEETGMDMETYT